VGGRLAGLTSAQRAWLWSIVAVAAAVRVAWALYATRTPAAVGDPFFYFEYGKRLAAGHGYDNYATGEPTAYYPVGYPAALAMVFWIVQHTPIPDDLPMAGALFQAALGTGSVVLVFVIARKLFGVTAGLVAAGITALFPNLVFYVAILQVETLFIFLFLLCVAIAVDADWSAGALTRNRALVLGGALGVCTLVRPFAIPLLGGLALAVWIASRSWRALATTLGWVALTFALVVAPWVVRNIVKVDAATISTNMGDTLCIDRYVNSTGRFRFVDEAGGCAPSSLSEAARNTENNRIALRFVREHPGEELHLIGIRAWYMMENDRDGLQAAEVGSGERFLGHRLRSVLGGVADGYFFVALALAVLGLPAFVRDRRADRIIVLAAIATLVGVPLLLWGSTRFHVPLLPFLAISAAGSIAWLLADGRFRSRTRQG
jgi:4-amino-4-deoxy-L-arabinose transferase-like glycosyltransferase